MPDDGPVVEDPGLQTTQPNLNAANPMVEAMRQELDAMRVTVANMVASAHRSATSGQSAGNLVAPIQPFSGQDAAVSAASWLAGARVRFQARQLAKQHWVATAMASLEEDPRSYVEQRLAKLAECAAEHQESEEPWEASWEDFSDALLSGPWQTKQTSFAVRSLISKLRLQNRQPVQVLVRKLNGLAAQLRGMSKPMTDDELIFALQQALCEQLPSWPLTVNPATAQPWPSFDSLCSYVLERDAAEPERCSKAASEAPWQQPRRRRARDETGTSSGDKPQHKRPRSATAARDKLGPNEREQLMRDGRCFLCKQQGHRASDVVSSSTGPKFVCPSRAAEKPSSLKSKTKKKTP